LRGFDQSRFLTFEQKFHGHLYNFIFNLKLLSFFQDAAGMCPHNLVRSQLEQHLNKTRNLAELGKILHETYGAVKALARLPNTPVTLQKINPPIQTFSVIPQSPTHFKIVFYSTYCLDIYVRSDTHILVRDAAISLFDQV
jgi:hypothetical protein